MDVIFCTAFLLESLAILLAISTQSNAKSSCPMQMYFRKMSRYGGSSLHQDDIISNHTVHFQNECSLKCLQTSTCVGFNYRQSHKYVINCQLSNKTRESEETGEWIFYQNVQTTVTLGESKLEPGQSCKDILAVNKCAASGTYWIKPGSSEPFQVYCDMETHGGGWTLVYSYTFTNYGSFRSDSNAVTPRPNWPTPSANVRMSTTPPLNESSSGAMDWNTWRDIGQEFMVKSTVNDWIVCQPNGGSLVRNEDGSVKCENINNVATACSGVVPDRIKWWSHAPSLLASSYYYVFDGATGMSWPRHDPCGVDTTNQKKGVTNPGGQIYLR